MFGSLDEKYRPRAFSDFEGQPSSAKFLSVLAKDKIRRNILLSGDLGSGKTSFARVYARALFCPTPVADGSPCNRDICRQCSEHPYLFEYDTALSGGEKRNVNAFLDKVLFYARSENGAFVFFDECHELSQSAMDSLLKRLEPNDQPIVYAFATTDTSNLRRTFTSRLSKVPVYALDHRASIAFMKAVAEKEHIQHSERALSLIAAFESGYPRALLKALETISVKNLIVNDSAVKSHYGQHDADFLVEYMTSLAEGDTSRQVRTMQRWPGLLKDKVAAVRGFLITMYYNDVLGEDAVCHPLAYSLKAERSDVALRFVRRFALNDSAALQPLWLRMVEFWAERSAGSLELSVPIFENFVTNGLSALAAPRVLFGGAAPVQSELVASRGGASQSLDVQSDESGFQAVRSIVHRSSFFIQKNGLFFNAAVVVSPGRNASDVDTITAVRAFRERVQAKFGGNDLFSAVTSFERGVIGLGRLLAYIPLEEGRGTVRDIEDLCENYQDDFNSLVELSMPSAETQAKKKLFHWQETLRLCRAFAVSADEAEQASNRELRQLFRGEEYAMPLREPEFTGALRNIEEGVDQSRLHFVSALDAGAWNHITSSWELDEFRFRKGEAILRRHQIEQAETEAQLCDLRRSWQNQFAVRKAKWNRRWGVPNA